MLLDITRKRTVQDSLRDPATSDVGGGTLCSVSQRLATINQTVSSRIKYLFASGTSAQAPMDKDKDQDESGDPMHLLASTFGSSQVTFRLD